jgi:hypothetical protein
MVDARADLFGIHPHELVRFVVPNVLEFFLADGADSVGLGGVRDDHVLFFERLGLLGCRCGVGARGRSWENIFCVVGGFDPFLYGELEWWPRSRE